MTRFSVLPCFLIAVACTPAPEISPHAVSAAAPKVQADLPPPSRDLRPSTPAPPAVVVPAQSRLPISYRQITSAGVTLSMVSFDDRDHQLRVADQPNGLGSRWTTAQAAATTYGGLAAINGGFFTPEGKPLGLLIETGTRRGYLNKSSLGAGVFISAKSRSAIVRRETYQQTSDSWDAFNLIQTGPMLAENYRTISGLSKNNRRPRSFIAWDGKHHWAIGYTSASSLSELSNALAGKSPAGFKIKVAVNLDGGRSSDLWVSGRVSGGGKSHRGFLNKPVRNYLVLTSR